VELTLKFTGMDNKFDGKTLEQYQVVGLSNPYQAWIGKFEDEVFWRRRILTPNNQPKQSWVGEFSTKEEALKDVRRAIQESPLS
jgi:hypothetical protein